MSYLWKQPSVEKGKGLLMPSAIKSEIGYCRFCEHIAYGGKALVDKPWLINKKYTAFVSLGSFVLGWALVFPKKHTLNLASEYESEEFWDFVNEVVAAVRTRFGKVAVFEHGAFYAGSKTGCGTDHAHLHIVPVEFSLLESVKKFDPSMVWEKCHVNDIEEKADGHEYLFFSDFYEGKETIGFVCMLEEGSSQFFRKVIAAEVGMPDKYNYKEHKFEDVAQLSLEALSYSFNTDSGVLL